MGRMGLFHLGWKQPAEEEEEKEEEEEEEEEGQWRFLMG